MTPRGGWLAGAYARVLGVSFAPTRSELGARTVLAVRYSGRGCAEARQALPGLAAALRRRSK